MIVGEEKSRKLQERRTARTRRGPGFLTVLFAVIEAGETVRGPTRLNLVLNFGRRAETARPHGKLTPLPLERKPGCGCPAERRWRATHLSGLELEEYQASCLPMTVGSRTFPTGTSD